MVSQVLRWRPPYGQRGAARAGASAGQIAEGRHDKASRLLGAIRGARFPDVFTKRHFGID